MLVGNDDEGGGGMIRGQDLVVALISYGKKVGGGAPKVNAAFNCEKIPNPSSKVVHAQHMHVDARTHRNTHMQHETQRQK